MRTGEHLVLVNVDTLQHLINQAHRAQDLLRECGQVKVADRLWAACDMVREEIEINRRRKRMREINKMLALLVILGLLLIVISGTSVAQDGLAATAAANEALEPVLGIQAQTIWALVALGALILVGAVEALNRRDLNKFFDRYEQALQRKDTRDYGEEKFKQSSLQVQDFILLAEGLFRVLGNANLPVVDRAIDATHSYLEAITDGKPNEAPEPENRPPVPFGQQAAPNE